MSPALAGAPKQQIGSATMENDGIIVMRLRMTQEVAAGDLEKPYVPGAPDDEAVRTCRICAPLALERPVLAPIRNARAAARWATSLSR